MSVDIMLSSAAVVLCVFVNEVRCDLTFPAGFKFGAATAAYQVEGAWNVSDKSENIWDRFTHTKPELIEEGHTGDVACDSYHRWEDDVRMAADLGLQFYRFSINWPRLLPTGFPNYISEDGKKYYNSLIDGLLERGVEPLITLYHWELPQRLQDLGGWTNPLIVEWFAEYARVVYALFADRVRTWITINEPMAVCDLPYDSGSMAPGVKDPDVAVYLCNKYLLLAHARAWRIYDQEYKPKYPGRMAINNVLLWHKAGSAEEQELTDLVIEYNIGRFSHPIYSKSGGWPPAIEKIIAKKSTKEGYRQSRLTSFTQEEIDYIRGTYDYYAVNHYTSRVVKKHRQDSIGFWIMAGVAELDAAFDTHPEWRPSGANWFFINPEGMRHILLWLKQHYGDIPILIAENGLATAGGLDDDDRIQYIRSHLEQVLLSIKEDSVNVTGYTVWSLMDNFEWMDGYTVKFGLYEVDFQDPSRRRTPRKSANYYRSIIKKHSLDVPTNTYRVEL